MITPSMSKSTASSRGVAFIFRLGRYHRSQNSGVRIQ
jgi:hypothetical protein